MILLLLLCVVFPITELKASALLIPTGKYKYTLTHGNIDSKSENHKEQRAELYKKIKCKISNLRQTLKSNAIGTAKYSKILEEIILLEKEADILSSYLDQSIKQFSIQYGLSDWQNIGLEFFYKENKFSNLQKNSSSNQEVSFYYKWKVLEKNLTSISVESKFIANQIRGEKIYFSKEFTIFSGLSKKIKSFDSFVDTCLSFRLLGNKIDGFMRFHYSFAISEGIKFNNGFMLINYSKYNVTNSYKGVNERTLYTQLSVAKILKMDSLEIDDFAVSLGYFMDKSLINKKYKISGIIVSLWLQL